MHFEKKLIYTSISFQDFTYKTSSMIVFKQTNEDCEIESGLLSRYVYRQQRFIHKMHTAQSVTSHQRSHSLLFSQIPLQIIHVLFNHQNKIRNNEISIKYSQNIYKIFTPPSSDGPML